MIAESKFARARRFDFCNAFRRRECCIISHSEKFSVSVGICAEADVFARNFNFAAVDVQAVGKVAAQYAVNVIGVNNLAALNAVSNFGISNRRESSVRNRKRADLISLNCSV